MDPLLAFNPNSSLVGILASPSVTPSYALLSAELSLSTPSLFGNSSTVVGISEKGQLLSAAVGFQNTLRLSNITSAGQDIESLTSHAQSLVDSFNKLQQSVANLNITNALSAPGVTGSSSLTLPLNVQAQASYANGDSSLTRLSQLGITYQPPPFPGTTASLSLDTDTLQAAFESDAAGAASLLSQASTAFSDVAGRYISQSGSQYTSLDALLQSTSDYSLLFNTPQRQTFNDLFGQLSSQPQTGNRNWGSVFPAINEYNMILQLFG